jgi:diketogulonate reductase-like aldo/keto reductase
VRSRSFGRTGVALPVIGQGTWNMEHDDRRSAIAALHRGLELGMTHIDTAEMYGSGEVERLVGEALRGKRERAFVASKVLPANASFRGVIGACEASLRRLAIAVLDLYLLHWPGEHPLEDTIRAFEELRQKGKIRFWGVSNFDERKLSAAVRIAGAGAVACNQVLYHLRERAIEHRVIPFCEEHDIAVVAYSPFGSGDFPSAESQGGRVLEVIAKARGVTARQIALAFLVRESPLFAIPKASRAAHVEDNAGAGEIELTPDEIARIDEAFPRGRARRGVPMI